MSNLGPHEVSFGLLILLLLAVCLEHTNVLNVGNKRLYIAYMPTQAVFSRTIGICLDLFHFV